MQIAKLQKQRERIQIPIPAIIDKNGGSFEVDLGKFADPSVSVDSGSLGLVSVEDAYGCKRSVSVPGVVVNVRRVKVRIRSPLVSFILTKFPISLPPSSTVSRTNARSLSWKANKRRSRFDSLVMA